MLVGLFGAAAWGETERFPANNPDDARPGNFFKLYEVYLAADETFKGKIVKALGGEENDQRLVQPLAEYDPDRLAETFAGSSSGVAITALEARWIRALVQDQSQFSVAMMMARTVVNMPTGTVEMPLQTAWMAHRALLLEAGTRRRENGQWPDLAGRYDAHPEGNCPFQSGPVEMEQRDFALEAVREGSLLLSGAIGVGQAYLVATEQFYLTVTTNEEGRVNLDVPDRLPELYRTDINSGGLVLVGQVYDECRITLSRQGGG